MSETSPTIIMIGQARFGPTAMTRGSVNPSTRTRYTPPYGAAKCATDTLRPSLPSELIPECGSIATGLPSGAWTR